MTLNDSPDQTEPRIFAGICKRKYGVCSILTVACVSVDLLLVLLGANEGVGAVIAGVLGRNVRLLGLAAGGCRPENK